MAPPTGLTLRQQAPALAVTAGLTLLPDRVKVRAKLLVGLKTGWKERTKWGSEALDRAKVAGRER
jgi:hypothetical protein